MQQLEARLGRAQNASYSLEVALDLTQEGLAIDADGNTVRQWRDHIHSPDDIWKEIVKAGKMPGTTSAPKLQPIAARIVMLQSGMRAPMGVKVQGPDLDTIEKVGLQMTPPQKYLCQEDAGWLLLFGICCLLIG